MITVYRPSRRKTIGYSRSHNDIVLTFSGIILSFAELCKCIRSLRQDFIIDVLRFTSELIASNELCRFLILGLALCVRVDSAAQWHRTLIMDCIQGICRYFRGAILHLSRKYDTIRDAIFIVRSKADISQLNLPGNAKLVQYTNVCLVSRF